MQDSLPDEAEVSQFEEAFGAGRNVSGSVMGAVMGATKEMRVEFAERGPFVAAAIAGNTADVGGASHRAKRGERGEVLRVVEAAILIQDDGAVKGDVVADEQAGGVLFNLVVERAESFDDRNADTAGVFGGDAMDPSCTRGNCEAVGSDDVVGAGKLRATLVVERPAN